MASHDKPNDDSNDGLIVPIEFTPYEDKSALFSYKFKWIHPVILVFVVLSLSAAWFVLTARSVFVEVNPITAQIEIDGLHFQLGQRYLIRTGSYQLTLSNPGYYDTATRLLVGADQSQNIPFEMQKLPGVVSITTTSVDGARVQIDGVDIGLTPLVDVPIAAGDHQLTIAKDRYLDYGAPISIEGRSQAQAFTARLEPAWATVSLTTSPSGAEVLVDGEVVGTTPLNAELLQGQRNLVLKLAGHKAWQEEFDVLPGADFAVPTVILIPADGLVFIRTNPTEASVTIDGEFVGLTPIEVALTPNENHAITFFKNGYNSGNANIRTQPNQERELNITLEPVLTSVRVRSVPEDAELYVNGESRGLANQTIELMAASQLIEIRKDGYVPYATEFTSRPGLDQEIRVTLKSLEQARQDQIQPMIVSAAGQNLKLFYPGSFTMGASRREAGRRPNEALRDIKLEKPFYLSLNEVTNAQYRLFEPKHSSGTVQGLTLNNEGQPVVQITWAQAARYCNWLSEQESLAPFYEVSGEEVVGFNPDSFGYRLPTEAEWAWAARTNGSGAQLKYPWGEELPPPENAGNFADVTSRNYLGQVLFDYNDNYLGSAPVGSFTVNQYGLYDLAGNVAEWVHDYYGALGAIGGVEVDPLGPLEGQFHTIRGSSWAHGTVTELRLSFRDFGEEPRDDVGFRVARYLED